MDHQLKALTLVCSLKPTPSESSTDKLARQVASELDKYKVESTIVRAVDYTIKPGVAKDMGEGDEWPELRQQMLDSDILIIATPTWAGHMSSVAQRVIERLDAELSETDEQGRPIVYDKVAGAIVVGNEDGAHKITADIFQALNDYGFTISANGSTYWNGEAMHKIDFKDLATTPEETATATKMMAAQLAHLAQLLREKPYPSVK